MNVRLIAAGIGLTQSSIEHRSHLEPMRDHEATRGLFVVVETR